MMRYCKKINNSSPDAPQCRHHRSCDDIHEVVITSQQISQTLQAMARQIQETYANHSCVVIIFLLKGAKNFANDLADFLKDVKFKFVPLRVSSYRGGTQSTGEIIIHDIDMLEINGLSVLLLDDIYDSGFTLQQVKARLESSGPLDIKTCVMFEKECKHKYEVDLDFVGLPVPDDFVVGYGLDYQERYRELHCVGTLKSEVTAHDNRYEQG